MFLGFFYQLIAVPSVLVLGFWFVLQLIDGFASLGAATEAAGGVAFFAHIGGFVAGAVLALPLRFLGRPRPADRRVLPSAGTDAPEALVAAPVLGAPPAPPDPTLPPPRRPGR